MRKDLSLKQAYLYIDEICESDIRNVDGHRRSAQKMRKVLQSYSRFSASDAPNTAIENDVFDISKNTLADYLKVLEDLFITNETEAWNPNFRSATAIRQSNTRYLADPSITTAALKMGPEDLLNDLQTFGLVFETLCVRDLKVYAQVLDADILHYRDAAGLECDAVFHGRNGKYGLIEIKLGRNRVEEGATNMLRLEKKIAASNQKIPDFLMVLTGTGFAHRREDGVYVVPIGCLKP
jgi:predicted AAA+ superfamily ATPase